MTSLTEMTAAPRAIDYLDQAARSRAGQHYKQRFLAALEVRAGQVVADIGCGPGTDLARLAEAVTGTGHVIGIDHDPEMVAQAKVRLAELTQVEVRTGDAHALPLADASLDRARADRVLQHLSDPARAVSELRRVIRPGGLVGFAEPDWDTLAVDCADIEVSRAFTRFMAARVANPTIGRQLSRLAVAGGFSQPAVDAITVTFTDFDAAEQILGLRRNLGRAVVAGLLPEADGQRWLEAMIRGPFLACFAVMIVTARG
ncbi:MAG TPA: methyltransferase domain-containing protein [Micromonosporaceae bacterium]